MEILLRVVIFSLLLNLLSYSVIVPTEEQIQNTSFVSINNSKEVEKSAVEIELIKDGELTYEKNTHQEQTPTGIKTKGRTGRSIRFIQEEFNTEQIEKPPLKMDQISQFENNANDLRSEKDYDLQYNSEVADSVDSGTVTVEFSGTGSSRKRKWADVMSPEEVVGSDSDSGIKHQKRNLEFSSKNSRQSKTLWRKNFIHWRQPYDRFAYVKLYPKAIKVASAVLKSALAKLKQQFENVKAKGKFNVTVGGSEGGNGNPEGSTMRPNNQVSESPTKPPPRQSDSMSDQFPISPMRNPGQSGRLKTQFRNSPPIQKNPPSKGNGGIKVNQYRDGPNKGGQFGTSPMRKPVQNGRPKGNPLLQYGPVNDQFENGYPEDQFQTSAMETPLENNPLSNPLQQGSIREQPPQSEPEGYQFQNGYEGTPFEYSVQSDQFQYDPTGGDFQGYSNVNQFQPPEYQDPDGDSELNQFQNGYKGTQFYYSVVPGAGAGAGDQFQNSPQSPPIQYGDPFQIQNGLKEDKFQNNPIYEQLQDDDSESESESSQSLTGYQLFSVQNPASEQHASQLNIFQNGVPAQNSPVPETAVFQGYGPPSTIFENGAQGSALRYEDVTQDKERERRSQGSQTSGKYFQNGAQKGNAWGRIQRGIQRGYPYVSQVQKRKQDVQFYGRNGGYRIPSWSSIPTLNVNREGIGESEIHGGKLTHEDSGAHGGNGGLSGAFIPSQTRMREGNLRLGQETGIQGGKGMQSINTVNSAPSGRTHERNGNAGINNDEGVHAGNGILHPNGTNSGYASVKDAHKIGGLRGDSAIYDKTSSALATNYGHDSEDNLIQQGNIGATSDVSEPNMSNAVQGGNSDNENQGGTNSSRTSLSGSNTNVRGAPGDIGIRVNPVVNDLKYNQEETEDSQEDGIQGGNAPNEMKEGVSSEDLVQGGNGRKTQEQGSVGDESPSMSPGGTDTAGTGGVVEPQPPGDIVENEMPEGGTMVQGDMAQGGGAMGDMNQEDNDVDYDTQIEQATNADEDGGGGGPIGKGVQWKKGKHGKGPVLEIDAVALIFEWITGLQNKIESLLASYEFQMSEEIFNMLISFLGIGFDLDSYYRSQECWESHHVNKERCLLGLEGCLEEYQICGGRNPVVEYVHSIVQLPLSVLCVPVLILLPHFAPFLALAQLFILYYFKTGQTEEVVFNFDRYFPLTEWELREHLTYESAALGLGIDTELLTLRDQAKFNSWILDEMARFLHSPENEERFWAVFGPAYRSTVSPQPFFHERNCRARAIVDSFYNPVLHGIHHISASLGRLLGHIDWKVRELIKHTIIGPCEDFELHFDHPVYLHNHVDVSDGSLHFRHFQRWSPNAHEITGNFKRNSFLDEDFICRPEFLGVHSPRLRGWWLAGLSHKCVNALGYKSHGPPGFRQAYFNMGPGDDTIIGFEWSSNYFQVESGRKEYVGGHLHDHFCLGDGWGGITTGVLRGGPGIDTLEIKPDFPQHIVRIFNNHIIFLPNSNSAGGTLNINLDLLKILETIGTVVAKIISAFKSLKPSASPPAPAGPTMSMAMESTPAPEGPTMGMASPPAPEGPTMGMASPPAPEGPTMGMASPPAPAGPTMDMASPPAPAETTMAPPMPTPSNIEATPSGMIITPTPTPDPDIPTEEIDPEEGVLLDEETEISDEEMEDFSDVETDPLPDFDELSNREARLFGGAHTHKAFPGIGPTLKLESIEIILGRKGFAEHIVAACGNLMINGQGGSDASPDIIQIGTTNCGSVSLNARGGLNISVPINTFVTNYNRSPSMTYHYDVRNDDVGRAEGGGPRTLSGITIEGQVEGQFQSSSGDSPKTGAANVILMLTPVSAMKSLTYKQDDKTYNFDIGMSYTDFNIKLAKNSGAKIRTVDEAEFSFGGNVFGQLMFVFNLSNSVYPFVSGAKGYVNVFNINSSYLAITGGGKDDFFIFGSNARVGSINSGGSGSNTIMMDPNMDAKSTIDLSNKRVSFPNKEENTKLTGVFQNVLGRENVADTLITCCDTLRVDLKNGGGTEAQGLKSMDVILIPSQNCTSPLVMEIQVHPFTNVTNRNTDPGTFYYRVSKVGTIQKKGTTLENSYYARAGVNSNEPGPGGGKRFVDLSQSANSHHYIMFDYEPQDFTSLTFNADTQEVRASAGSHSQERKLEHELDLTVKLQRSNRNASFPLNGQAEIVLLDSSDNNNLNHHFPRENGKTPVFKISLTKAPKTQIVGGKYNPNHFYIQSEYKSIKGGAKGDLFIVGENARIGSIDGGGGDDVLVFAEPNQKSNAAFELGLISTARGGTFKFVVPSTHGQYIVRMLGGSPRLGRVNFHEFYRHQKISTVPQPGPLEGTSEEEAGGYNLFFELPTSLHYVDSIVAHVFSSSVLITFSDLKKSSFTVLPEAPPFLGSASSSQFLHPKTSKKLPPHLFNFITKDDFKITTDILGGVQAEKTITAQELKARINGNNNDRQDMLDLIEANAETASHLRITLVITVVTEEGHMLKRVQMEGSDKMKFLTNQLSDGAVETHLVGNLNSRKGGGNVFSIGPTHSQNKAPIYLYLHTERGDEEAGWVFEGEDEGEREGEEQLNLIDLSSFYNERPPPTSRLDYLTPRIEQDGDDLSITVSYASKNKISKLRRIEEETVIFVNGVKSYKRMCVKMYSILYEFHPLAKSDEAGKKHKNKKILWEIRPRKSKTHSISKLMPSEDESSSSHSAGRQSSASAETSETEEEEQEEEGESGEAKKAGNGFPGVKPNPKPILLPYVMTSAYKSDIPNQNPIGAFLLSSQVSQPPQSQSSSSAAIYVAANLNTPNLSVGNNNFILLKEVPQNNLFGWQVVLPIRPVKRLVYNGANQ